MSISSEPHHKEAFLRMVCGHSGPYFLLHIWDGRYAAFWAAGFDIEHCIAVAEHMTHEEHGSTWPFAFISANKEEVECYINDPRNGEDGDGEFS